MINKKAFTLLMTSTLFFATSLRAQILIVASNAEHHVALLDATTFKTLATFPTGEGPHEIAVSKDGRYAYIAIPGPREKSGNSITVLDLKQRIVKTNFNLGEYTQPHDLKVSNDGELLWVTCAPVQTVLEIATTTGEIKRNWKTGQEGGWMLAVTPDERKLYVANFEGKSISVIDRGNDAVRTIPMSGGQMALDVSPTAHQVTVLDIAKRKPSRTFPTGKTPDGIAWSN